MVADALDPRIDRRISELLRREGRLSEPKSSRPISICISRKYGCEGYPLAEELKQRLEAITANTWHIFDKALLDKISQDHGLSRQFLDTIEDHSSYIDKILAPLMKSWTTGNEVFGWILRYILKITQEGNAIIVGRGASMIAQDNPGCFHFRIEAPLDYRIQSIVRRFALTPDAAEQLVLKNQGVREHFINSYFGKDVSDVNLYHAVYNCSKLSISEIADNIVTIVTPHLVGATKKIPA